MQSPPSKFPGKVLRTGCCCWARFPLLSGQRIRLSQLVITWKYMIFKNSFFALSLESPLFALGLVICRDEAGKRLERGQTSRLPAGPVAWEVTERRAEESWQPLLYLCQPMSTSFSRTYIFLVNEIFFPPSLQQLVARILKSDSSSASNKYYKDVLPACILFYALPAPRPAAPGSCAGEIKGDPGGESGHKVFFLPQFFNLKIPPRSSNFVGIRDPSHFSLGMGVRVESTLFERGKGLG